MCITLLFREELAISRSVKNASSLSQSANQSLRIGDADISMELKNDIKHGGPQSLVLQIV